MPAPSMFSNPKPNLKDLSLSDRYGVFNFGYVALIVVIAVVVMFSTLSLEKEVESTRLEANLKSTVHESVHHIVSSLNGVTDDLLTLSKQSSLRQLLIEQSDILREQVSSDIFFFAQQHRYSQVRLLDINGQELVRVDHANNQTYLVPKERLQDKSNRYYYRDSLLLSSGEVYQSVFDLNVENGKIETPWKPMIRYVTPVFFEGKKIGFVIINFNAERMLKHIESIVDNSGIAMQIVNKSGYYLFDSSKTKPLWGFMFDSPDTSLKDEDPQLWSEVRNLVGSKVATKSHETYFMAKICSLGCFSTDGLPFLLTHSQDIPWYLIAKPAASQSSGFDLLMYWHIVILIMLLLMAFIGLELSRKLKKSMIAGHSKTQRLEEEVSLFENLFMHLPDGVMLVDGEAKVRKINPLVEKIFQKERVDILGQRIEVFMPAHMHAQHHTFTDKFFKNPKVIAVTRGNPFQYKAEDGSDKLLEVIVVPVPNASMIKALVLVRDVTKSLEMERKVVQQHKFDAVGNFMNNLSRDFAIHLQAIMNNMQLMKGAISSDSELYMSFHEIEKATNKAHELTQKLMSIAYQNRIKIECRPLNKVLEETESFLQRCINEQVHLQVHYQDHSLGILVDTAEFNASMVNLVLNAQESMGESGLISLEAKSVHLSRKHESVESGELSVGDYIEICLSDTGQGMSGDELNRALEPFFSTKVNHSGLGLSSVYSMIRQSKGNMHIESKEGEGTQVYLYFKACDAYFEK